MGRTFNTAGPCRPEYDYMLPPLDRLPELPALIDEQKYVVLHAPRQTGKTTTIRAFADALTQSGKYAAVAFSCERGKDLGDDDWRAQREVLSELRTRARMTLPPELRPSDWPENVDLRDALTDWALECPRPLVLFFDEIDALTGRSLISVLSQLRSAYPDRPEAFPWSVVLCGMRNVRDYRAAAGSPNPERLGTSSPFNIAVAALLLGNFTLDEVAALYAQHTADTGQEFTESAVEYAFEVTQGQPWLVNALAREVTLTMGVPPMEPIGPRRLETAKERLIKTRAAHLDSLAARLDEDRVRRILQPVLAGEIQADPTLDETYDDDLMYVRDLGLVALTNPLRIANPVYAEVIPRVLAARSEGLITANPRSFVRSDGTLDFEMLLREFMAFWIANGDVLTVRETYHEVAAQMVLMAFLHRIVNGGGYVDREYGVGRGRIDVLIRWPYEDPNGNRVFQKEALELKVWRDKRANPLDVGLEQLDGYLDRVELKTGVLVLFDRRECAEPIHVRTRLESARTPQGRDIILLRA